MEIDVRADRKLRGSAAAQAAFGPLVEALCGSDADLARMRVVCDWIQYRNNFRDTAMVRPVLPATQVAATPTAPRSRSSTATSWPSTCAAARGRGRTWRPR